MAKYEAEDFETFMREVYKDGVDRVGLKTLFEQIAEKENSKLIRGSIIVTASKKHTNHEDYYVYSEIVSTQEVDSKEKFDEVKKTTNKRIEDMIEQFQKSQRAFRLFRGRVLP